MDHRPHSDVLSSLRSLERRVAPANWPLYPERPDGAHLFRGDAIQMMTEFASAYPEGIFDMVFADPPYFLSNGGISCQSGRVVSVDKGAWDRSRGFKADHEWNRAWLSACQKVMKPDATIWVTGSQHSIFSIGFAMREIGMKPLNFIAWEKPDPPPNLSGRYFQHSTEFLIWAARSERSRHCFNERAMRRIAGGGQMRTVWRIRPPGPEEKRFGRHPTQKPVALVLRAILASTAPGNIILDPFVGSGTTAVAATLTGRQCFGIDEDETYLTLAAKRIKEALDNRLAALNAAI